MKTKSLLSIAIIAALPFAATAENISGAMYTAPAHADNNHPAPTTNAGAPYGRIDIDTADQEHIATTAYVKGAYNSAIAAVNKVDTSLTAGLDEKQDKLINYDSNDVVDDVFSAETGSSMMGDYIGATTMEGAQAGQEQLRTWEDRLLSAGGVIGAIGTAVNLQRVLVYTTWDNDSAKTAVPLANQIGVQADIY